MQPTTLMIERPGDRYWQLICKLRWIGMDEDEAHMQATLQLLREQRANVCFQVTRRNGAEYGTRLSGIA